MNRFARLSQSMLLSLSLTAAVLLFSGIFQQLKAYEEECLKCHKDYGRSPESMPKDVSSLYVDQEQWEKDVHYEVVGLACDDCHMDATPETHPKEGLAKVNCGECHEDVVESYYKSAHFLSETEQGRKKPDCADCHPPHRIRSSEDPESSVSKENLAAICLSCHQDIESSTRLLNSLLVFRISAHRKSNISNRFDASECINCHYTEAVGHGDNPSGNYCVQCHAADAKVGKVVFGPFHLDPSLKEQPLVFFVWVLNILILLAVIGGIVFLIARGFVKSKGGNTAQQPEG
jgi:predicted CXXCH cytochrome family protein